MGHFDSGTLAEQVRQHLDTLPRAERRVAHALLARYPMAGLGTVASFAERARTSSPTIIRFVGRLGFANYGEFQSALRRELEERLQGPLARYEHPPAGGDSGDTCERVSAALCRNIQHAAAALNRSELALIVKTLADERRSVHLIGGRFTGMLAGYFFGYLRELRPRVLLMVEGGQCWVEWLLDVGRRDVLIVFDFRRYQQGVIELAHNADNRGVTIVLITDTWTSPIAQSARHVLCVPVEVPGAYDSGTAGLALVEILVAALVERLDGKARERLSRLERTREHLSTPPAADPAAEERRT